MMWIAIAQWAFLLGIVAAAIIVANRRDAKVEAEYDNRPLNVDDDKLRWAAVLTTKYKPNCDAPENFECKIKVIDANKKFKPIYGLAYGQTVTSAEANAVAKLPDMITKAYDRAEAPTTRIVRF